MRPCQMTPVNCARSLVRIDSEESRMRFVASKQQRADTAEAVPLSHASSLVRDIARQRAIVLGLALAVVAIVGALLFAHLGDVPRTWFDEGSHLHVPKTLVQTGHYADRSSEGLRAFGPTIGIGPTVMLP